MRIGIVIERIETWRGGAETSTMELAGLLAQRGHDVHVVTASRCPSTPDLTIHHVPSAGPVRPLRTRTFVRRAAILLPSLGADVVHAVAPLAEADVYQPRGGSVRATVEQNVALRAGRAARLLKRATSLVNVKVQTLRELERRICRPGGPVIAAVSQLVARQFERYYGLTAPRVRVIFNGVAAAVEARSTDAAGDRRLIRAQYNLRPESFVLLAIAHNFRLKGIHRLIEAAARVATRPEVDLRVLVIGRDNPVPMQKLAWSVGLAERVIFVGPTPRVAAFLNAADVLVHPTYYDPCSRVVLEALVYGVPCVTTRCNGAAEAIEDGVNGFVIDSPDNVGALAGVLTTLLDAATRRAVGANAARSSARLSMTRHVDELLGLYEELAASRRRVGRSH